MDPPTSTSSVAPPLPPPPPPPLAALPPSQSSSVLDIYSNQLLPPPLPPAQPQQLQPQPPVSHHDKEAAKYAAAVDTKYSAMSLFNNNVVGYGASAAPQPPVSKAKYPDYTYNGSGSGGGAVYQPPVTTSAGQGSSPLNLIIHLLM